MRQMITTIPLRYPAPDVHSATVYCVVTVHFNKLMDKSQNNDRSIRVKVKGRHRVPAVFTPIVLVQLAGNDTGNRMTPVYLKELWSITMAVRFRLVGIRWRIDHRFADILLPFLTITYWSIFYPEMGIVSLTLLHTLFSSKSKLDSES